MDTLGSSVVGFDERSRIVKNAVFPKTRYIISEWFDERREYVFMRGYTRLGFKFSKF